MKNVATIIILFLGIFSAVFRIEVLATSTNFSQTIYSITECNDGIDNDGDGGIDFATDPQCVAWADTSETILESSCSDTIDNDNDGSTDFPNDPECSSPTDQTEDIVEQGSPLENLNDIQNNNPVVTNTGFTPEQPTTFINQVIDGLDKMVFEWSPIGRIINIDSFDDLQNLEVNQRTNLIILSAGGFGLLIALIMYVTLWLLRRKYKNIDKYEI